MQIAPITTNIQSLKKKSIQNFKSKDNSPKSETAQHSEKSNKMDFMSGVSFKGYTNVQTKRVYSTSGYVINENDVDKGWHSDVKKVIAPKGPLQRGWGAYVNEVPYKTYIADVNETVDPYFLPNDINFLVVYEKPQDIYLSDIKEKYKNGDVKDLSFDKHIDYEWAWKDQYQKEYDEQYGNLNNLNPFDRKVAEGELKAKSDKMYAIAQKIDKMEALNGLLGEAKSQNNEPIKNYIEKNNTINNLSGMISREEDENKKLYDDIEKADKAFLAAPEAKKEEAHIQKTRAIVKKRMIDHMVEKATNGSIKSLDETIELHKKQKEDTINSLIDLENSNEYKTTKNVYESTLSGIENIYKEFFYDKINR